MTLIRMHKNIKATSGFTIVELLIVIVVIGILAALVVVSFRGIQDRARRAELTSNLRSASIKIRTFGDGTTYPTTITSLGIKSDDDTNYAYTADNTVAPATFCLAASRAGLSMYIDQTNSPALEGVCAGASDVGDGVSTEIIPSNEYSTQLGGKKAFDGSTSSSNKWLATQTNPNIIFSMTTPIIVTSYSIVSANDSASRDPKAWTLQGSTDRIAWTTIDTQLNQDFPSRYMKNSYTFSNNKSFKHYKFNVTQNSGATWTQIAELTLDGGTVIR